jgi:methylmalonyl-CoA mutase C-terminal domain/subunit
VSSTPAPKTRILVGKVGLDGHDRGVKITARALRDAGYEVIYTGLHQTPEMVVETALQEDVAGIGLSILSGAHNTLVPKVLRLLRERDADDVVVFVGGIIPKEDQPGLLAAGVRGIFTPGATTSEIVDFVRREVEGQR